MAARGDDRRVQRTRNLLRDALTALIAERGYESLTVQDVLDRANLGRATFYAHYRDKDDLLMDSIARLRTMFDTGMEHASLSDWSLELIRHTHDYHSIYKAMVGKPSGVLIMSFIRSLIVEKARSELGAKDRSLATEHTFEIQVQYVASSLLGLLTWWLDGGCPCSPEELHVAVWRLIEHGIGG